MPLPIRLSSVALGLCSVGLVGCGSDSLEDPEIVQVWATNGSAVAVYSNVRDPISFADGEHSFADPACPVTTDDGSTVRIAGGCTDADGGMWVGSATIVRTATGNRMLTLDGYGRLGGELDSTLSGTAEVRSPSATMHEFDLDIMRDGLTTTSIMYSGTIEGGYQTATTWNGSGVVDRDGFGDATGIASVTTVDEVMDGSICSGQPVSGHTTIVSDDETAVITYDGATDCDDAQAARFTFNGEDRGLVTGINCSAVAFGSGGSAPIAAFACLGGLVLVRGIRRRRR
jgi:hypothetical protein